MNQASDLAIDITDYNFSKESLLRISTNKWVKGQWPVVYIIQNEQQKLAYIGESTNALIRINSHLGNPKRGLLNKVSIIGCDKFNKSATLDIESQLIQYIISDNSFGLQNCNNGLVYHKYYQDTLYANLFKEIWTRLLEKKIVNKSLEDIQNSDFFKYSPYKALNGDQLNSVLEIIEGLNKKQSNHIVVKGSAGTGKTILATYLIKLLTSQIEELNLENADIEKYREVELLIDFRKKFPAPSIALVIAMSSLRKTLQKIFDKIPGLNKSMVISPTETFKKKYDILIVDEAHRLRQRKNISWLGVFTKNNNKLGIDNTGTELDWIIHNSTHQIFFYDADQSIKPSDVKQYSFDSLLKSPATIQLELKSQMRVKAGADYISFVDDLLNCRLDKNALKFEPENYELRVFESFASLYSELKIKEDTFKLSRLVAGYSWPWVSRDKKDFVNHDIEIEGLKFCWNKTDKDWIGSKTSFQEIGCIHTTQGYDLNYVGVIFGKEIKYNPETREMEIIPKNYFDRNGKAGIKNRDELKAYIINIYKTIMYRGAYGTYIYACDENLRKYLQESIHKRNPVVSLKILDVKGRNSIRLYDITVAAGNFSALQKASDFKWVELPETYQAREDYFVCKVIGESMNKKIPNGSWCLFQMDPGGSREGKIVLVEHYSIQDSDFGSGFTIKSYHSVKEISQDEWSHKTIMLKPLSFDSKYNDIILQDDATEELKVIGVFLNVLE
jgi:DUF2075 family protein/DNA replication protein DnaC